MIGSRFEVVQAESDSTVQGIGEVVRDFGVDYGIGKSRIDFMQEDADKWTRVSN